MTLASNAIIGRLVLHMIDAGYRVELSDQDGGGLYLYGWPDGAAPLGKASHWVSLTPAATLPCEVIRDYTTNLSKTLKPVIDYADTLEAIFNADT